MNTLIPEQARPTREERADAIAVDGEYVLDLPPREAMSLLTVPTLTDPTATGTTTNSSGTTDTTAPTTTSPTTTSPSTTSPATMPTDLSSLPIVSKFDPSRLGII